MFENESFGAWLKQRRKELDLTQATLAARVGCAAETIRKIEADRLRPSRQLAERLAEHLQVSPAERATFVQQARARAHPTPHEPTIPTPAGPLAALRRSTLPASLTPLIGRARESATLWSLLAGDAARLVTLVGPPGIGKTRLSLQVARDLQDHFLDGVYFVALAPLSDPEQVASAIARSLDLQELAGQSLRESLAHALHAKHLLLVLDNFEHVLAAAPLVAELLAAAPRLAVLATSRTPLHVYGEHEYVVPPLAVPDLRQLPPFAQLVEYDAVRLFEARARAVQGDFRVTPELAAIVAEICARLDGLPLAIELAARRLKLFSPTALLRQLSRQLEVLRGGARNLPERQQTMRGAIDWSFHLLRPHEQQLFARFSVFVGGCTAEGVAAVCDSDKLLALDVVGVLESLLDHSLLQREIGSDGEPRFRMLEPIREFARERLQADGVEHAVRGWHSAYYLSVAEAAEPELQGPEQVAWLDRLEVEHDNFRAALRWSVQSGDAETGLRLASALGRFWLVRGHWSEGSRWLDEVLAHSDALPPGLRAKALYYAGGLADYRGEAERQRVVHNEALGLYRQLGDKAGMATVLNCLGNLTSGQGETEQATQLYEESLALFRELADIQGMANVLCNLAGQAEVEGDAARARALLEESLRLYRQRGNAEGMAGVLYNLGLLVLHHRDLEQATLWLNEAWGLWQQVGHRPGLASILFQLGRIAYAQRAYAQAVALYDQSLALARDLNTDLIALPLYGLGCVARAQHDYRRATALLQESLTLFREHGDTRCIGLGLEALAGVAVAGLRQPERASRLLGAAESLRAAYGVPLTPFDHADYDRDMATIHAQLDEAALEAAWVEGRAMTVEQAIAYALEADEDSTPDR